MRNCWARQMIRDKETSRTGADNAGICAHVLDGVPLTTKKSKSVDTKKRRASEGEHGISAPVIPL